MAGPVIQPLYAWSLAARTLQAGPTCKGKGVQWSLDTQPPNEKSGE
eukprot:CAMPEP_0204115394 /NCGR_PEP_ID=MMETSP0361-20130328/4804_1 /ASSEMBLY_ACC=CAM_ASM_000343 /TAXON_ID=268821 /ORGANISM="Scrippsiella Hangoei, Strain SHTV-5" /LENGTH=45 /DNA_ID= /DNA_START= /DNA_END= /DNA_ORIENTATION=